MFGYALNERNRPDDRSTPESIIACQLSEVDRDSPPHAGARLTADSDPPTQTHAPRDSGDAVCEPLTMTDFRIEWTRATGGAIDRGFDSRSERDDYYTQLRDKYPDLQAKLYEVESRPTMTPEQWEQFDLRR